MNTSTRYYDIDWLRVLGTIGVFLFHVARFFNDEDWHVKNLELSFGATVFVNIFNQFIMPLFFVLSAFAIYYAIQKRTNKQFLSERVNRLLIPLIFGIFTIIIPQVYIERVTHGDFAGNFFQFIPEYFKGWYAFGGNFAWMGLHLWYLLMLFLFSLIMLPVFRFINHANTKNIADFFTKPFAIYLFFIPIAIIETLVNFSPETVGRRNFGGWSPLTYLMIFLLSYFLMTDSRYRDSIIKLRFFSLTFALVALTFGFYLVLAHDLSTYSVEFSIIRGFNTWCWILAFIGLAGAYLNFNNSFLKYASEAALPFYILHQSVIVILGYFIRTWDLAVFPKYILLASLSFMIIMALYEGIIKRIDVTRRLFGMKG